MPVLALLLLLPLSNAANLSCSVKTSCGVNETDVLHMSDLTNAHAELPYMSNFTNRICCIDSDAQTTIGTTGGTTFLRLSEESNAMVETASGTNFSYPANISSSNPSYSLSCGYGFSCAGYDTCLASISATANAHIGNCSAFTTKVCCSLQKVNCPVINSPGTYVQSMNFTGAPHPVSGYTGIDNACVLINSSDVVYDCAGYNITNDGASNAAAVHLTGTGSDVLNNITVKNCGRISDYKNGIVLFYAENSTITNNTLTNISFEAVRLANSSGNNITFNLVHDIPGSAFYLQGSCRNNLFQDNTAHGCDEGISIDQGNANTTLRRNLIYNNSYDGIYLYGSNSTVLEGNVLYNNRYDFMARSLSSPMDYRMANTLFLNPAGTYQNFTNLSVNDSLSAGERYFINWSSNSTALPAKRISFRGKFADIAAMNGTPSLDRVVWHWTVGELGGYTESSFELWKYNASWAMLNATPSTFAHTLSLTNMDPASTYGILQFTNTAPFVTNVVLNSTYGTNYSDENLTVYWSAYDADNDAIFNITNWYRNGTSLAALNMPFEMVNRTSSNNARDYSGYGNDGSEGGGVLWNGSSGHDGKGAYQFDGVDDYIEIAHDPSLNITNGITIAAWIRLSQLPNASGATYTIVSKRLGGYDMYVASDNTLRCYLENLTDPFPSGTPAPINDTAWHHVAATYDGSYIRTYLDGQMQLEDDSSGLINSSAVPLGIGSRGSTLFNLFNGTIDQVMVFNHSLSGQQINSLYNNRTDRIVSQETEVNDVWQACITPNDGYEDGLQNCSNNVTVRAAPAAPTIQNLNATNVSYTTATLNCNLTSNGNQDPDTWIYYGTSDGGTNPASWDANVSTGTQGGGPFSQNAGGLIQLTQYFYRCFANNSAGSAWGAPATNFTTLYLALPNATNVTLYGVNVTNRTDMPRFNNTGPASAGTAPGNLTILNLSASQLSGRWAAFYGNVTGNIVLTDVPGANFVYSWTWDPAAGGVVCLSTNSSLATTFGVQQANGSDIDSAWGFYPLATDSGANTFIGTNCTLDIGEATISNISYADTGQAGGFMTCPIKNSLAPTKEGIVFCAMIEQNGTAWNGQPVDFEVLVPTPSEPGSTETYYFYANLE